MTQQPSATTAGCSIFGVCVVDASTGKFDIGTFEDDQFLSRLTTLVAQVGPGFGWGSVGKLHSHGGQL